MSESVFVIGGGPAGLTAAIAARRKGFEVTVADARRPPVDKACGEGLMPDGVAAAAELGLCFRGEPMPGIRFFGEGKTVDAPFPGKPALGIRRTELHRVLVNEAERLGVCLLWSTPVKQPPQADWIVKACGVSNVPPSRHCRYGFRQHYRVSRWTDYLEIYWAEGLQVYVTPTAPDEVGIAVLSRNPRMRVANALRQFPFLAERLGCPTSTERGSITGSHLVRRIVEGNTAFIGDASGTVDAITGEGLALGFRQSLALANAMKQGDLACYDREHRRLARHPRMMARLILTMDRSNWLRRRAFAAMRWQPQLFRSFVALHVHS